MSLKVVFYRSDVPREQIFARHMELGLRAFGDELDVRMSSDYGEDKKYEGPTADTDVMICYGVKSANIVKDHITCGTPYIFSDKGYSRGKDAKFPTITKYTRLSVNEFQPISYFQKTRHPSDRWDRLGGTLKSLRQDRTDNLVVFASSSQKFYDYHGIGELKAHDEKTIKRIKKIFGLSDEDRRAGIRREIIYRPKPSYVKRHLKGETVHSPLGADIFSGPDEHLSDYFERCHCLVTFASNSAVEALINGVPVVAYGPTIAAPLIGSALEQINKPPFPDEATRTQWAYDLAYHQWTLDELASGEAWGHIRKRVKHVLEAKVGR